MCLTWVSSAWAMLCGRHCISLIFITVRLLFLIMSHSRLLRCHAILVLVFAVTADLQHCCWQRRFRRPTSTRHRPTSLALRFFISIVIDEIHHVTIRVKCLVHREIYIPCCSMEVKQRLCTESMLGNGMPCM